MSQTSDPQQQIKKYRGNCHCGALVYEATIPEIAKALSCDCNLCTKKGALWTAISNDADFKIIKGQESDLTVYEFGPKTKSHKSCPTCGSAVFGRTANKTIILNVRCIQELNIWELPITRISAGDPNLPYEAPEFKGPEPKTDAEPSKIYHGSCHCGAVTVAVKTHPLDDNYPGTIAECNCSICQRNGYIWIYPKPEEVVVQGEENLAKYSMGAKMMHKTFCRTCGIAVGNRPNHLSTEEIAALSPQNQKFYGICFGIEPINIRLFNNFDINTVKPTRLDGYRLTGDPYINP